MKKSKQLLSKSKIAGAALLLGSLGAQAGEPNTLREGVLVAKNLQSATVRDCSTNRLVTLRYANNEAPSFLVGESIGFTYDEAVSQGYLVAHYPDQKACPFYHS